QPASSPFPYTTLFRSCVICGSSRLDAEGVECVGCGGSPATRSEPCYVCNETRNKLLANADELKSLGLRFEEHKTVRKHQDDRLRSEEHTSERQSRGHL